MLTEQMMPTFVLQRLRELLLFLEFLLAQRVILRLLLEIKTKIFSGLTELDWEVLVKFQLHLVTISFRLQFHQQIQQRRILLS